MPRTFLRDAQAGDWIEDVFVITQKQLSTTQAGKPFIKCFIGDRTRQVTARMWNANPGMFNAMPDGGFLRVAGRVENYQDNLQFIIERFWIVDDATEVNLEELLPTTENNIDEMFRQLKSLLASITQPQLKAFAEAYLADESLMVALRRAPAAMSFHHGYVGGLLEHTLGMCQVVDRIAPLYPKLNRDLLLVGAFIHDLAKTWELTYAAGFGYSDGGQLVGHIAKGAVWVEEKAKVASEQLGSPISPDLVMVLQHMVLSHHGLPEHGAAKVPATPEALALHHIDNLDAKLFISLAARTPAAGDNSNFTDFNKALSTRIYRTDPAPMPPEQTP